tara:strand:+ start:214 stop:753 length:540 start_codon:yes stop_codon:yes gene_type:complete
VSIIFFCSCGFINEGTGSGIKADSVIKNNNAMDESSNVLFTSLLRNKVQNCSLMAYMKFFKIRLSLDMRKYLSLLLFVSFAYPQINNNLEVETGWYANGQKMFQRSYKDGNANGEWTHWYANGQLWTEGTYINGKLEGEWITFYDNGQKWIEGNHKDGQRYGEWTFYKEDGKIYELKKY